LGFVPQPNLRRYAAAYTMIRFFNPAELFFDTSIEFISKSYGKFRPLVLINLQYLAVKGKRCY
jgi:hypothetical protein